jgi:hypothetical protein
MGVAFYQLAKQQIVVPEPNGLKDGENINPHPT